MLLRKYISIFFLLVMLFNMIGYRAWFYFVEKSADASMEARLDTDQYDETDLVSLTIPLHNPYQLEQKTFERVDGEISFHGKTYKYVKRRVSEGNLLIRCIPATHKMVLKKAGTDYGNATNDLAKTSKNSSRNGFQKNLNGSNFFLHDYPVQLLNFSKSVLLQNHFFLKNLPNTCIASPCKPPRDRA